MQLRALPQRGPCDWFPDNLADKSLGNDGKSAWTGKSATNDNFLGQGLCDGRTPASARHLYSSTVSDKGVTNGRTHLSANSPAPIHLQDKDPDHGQVIPWTGSPPSRSVETTALLHRPMITFADSSMHHNNVENTGGIHGPRSMCDNSATNTNVENMMLNRRQMTAFTSNPPTSNGEGEGLNDARRSMLDHSSGYNTTLQDEGISPRRITAFGATPKSSNLENKDPMNAFPSNRLSSSLKNRSMNHGHTNSFTGNPSSSSLESKGLNQKRVNAFAGNPSSSSLENKSTNPEGMSAFTGNSSCSTYQSKGTNHEWMNTFVGKPPAKNLENKGLNHDRTSTLAGKPLSSLHKNKGINYEQANALTGSLPTVSLEDMGTKHAGINSFAGNFSPRNLEDEALDFGRRGPPADGVPSRVTGSAVGSEPVTHLSLRKSSSTTNELEKWKKKTQRLEQQIQKLSAESQSKQSDNLKLKDKIRKISGKNDHLTRQLREVKLSRDEEKDAAKYTEDKFVRLDKKLRDFDGAHRDEMTEQMDANRELSKKVDRLEEFIEEQKKMMDETLMRQEIEKLKKDLAASVRAHQEDVTLRIGAETRSHRAERTCIELQKELEAAAQTICSLQDASEAAPQQSEEVLALEEAFQSLASAHAQKEEEAQSLEHALRLQIRTYQEELQTRSECRSEKEVAYMQEQTELMKETLLAEIQQLRNDSGSEAQCSRCNQLALEKEQAQSEKEKVESDMVTLRRLYDESVHKALGMQADMEQEIARNDALKIPWGFHVLPDVEKDFFLEAEARGLAVIPEEE